MTTPDALATAVNGTGVILHTGLGRAVLPPAARQAMLEIAAGYCTLEIDVQTGKRGARNDIVNALLHELTGAETAVVVNNNAAAVMLILHALALDREVIVSRGQLVEIGGSFRMPDVMTQSGARLVSVGAVNHTTIEDYRRAITDRTALLMAVHRSNFEVVGEDVETPLEELVALGRDTGIPVVHDLGSGVLLDLSRYGLHREPTVPDSVAAGVDIVCFSGDKLLGGPQAGIIVGDAVYLDRIKKDPLMRALRVDKMTFAALAATLELFRDQDTLPLTHPVIRMLAESVETLEQRAQDLAGRLGRIFQKTVGVSIESDVSEIGGGALPSQQLPTRVVALAPSRVSNHEIAACFRRHTPPVFGRLSGDRFLLDVRTLRPEDLPHIEQGAQQVLASITQHAGFGV